MKITGIKSPITFKSGYPLGPGGHWMMCRPDIIRNYQYPGYPGVIPDDTSNPYGGMLNNLNVLA